MSHYTLNAIRDEAELAQIIRSLCGEAWFTDDDLACMNWVFFSTSGVHGSYGNLDDEEVETARKTHEEYAEDEAFNEDLFTITATIYKPRMITVVYGEALFRRDEIPWLRTVVARTLEGMRLSQRGNLP